MSCVQANRMKMIHNSLYVDHGELRAGMRKNQNPRVPIFFSLIVQCARVGVVSSSCPFRRRTHKHHLSLLDYIVGKMVLRHRISISRLIRHCLRLI